MSPTRPPLPYGLLVEPKKVSSQDEPDRLVIIAAPDQSFREAGQVRRAREALHSRRPGRVDLRLEAQRREPCIVLLSRRGLKTDAPIGPDAYVLDADAIDDVVDVVQDVVQDRLRLVREERRDRHDTYDPAGSRDRQQLVVALVPRNVAQRPRRRVGTRDRPGR